MDTPHVAWSTALMRAIANDDNVATHNAMFVCPCCTTNAADRTPEHAKVEIGHKTNRHILRLAIEHDAAEALHVVLQYVTNASVLSVTRPMLRSFDLFLHALEHNCAVRTFEVLHTFRTQLCNHVEDDYAFYHVTARKCKNLDATEFFNHFLADAGLATRETVDSEEYDAIHDDPLDYEVEEEPEEVWLQEDYDMIDDVDAPEVTSTWLRQGVSDDQVNTTPGHEVEEGADEEADYDPISSEDEDGLDNDAAEEYRAICEEEKRLEQYSSADKVDLDDLVESYEEEMFLPAASTTRKRTRTSLDVVSPHKTLRTTAHTSPSSPLIISLEQSC